MAQISNLNVAPYFDDFNQNDNYHKVLFRPGYSIQARELTTLQSILQNQIERHGRHTFKEGSVVIPGQVSYSNAYASLKIESTFAGEDIKLEQYLNQKVPVIITGETSGVQAKIFNFSKGTTSVQPYLYGQLIKVGTDNQRTRFINGENLSVNIATTHETSYSAGIVSLKAFTEDDSNISCVQIGSAVTVEAGVYFVRGQFVRCVNQTLILSPNSNNFTAKIGFRIYETIETPENNVALTDNASGSTNYAAGGAHRIKYNLRLDRVPFASNTDKNFIELIRLRNGRIVSKPKANTEYNYIGQEMARRTFDESGDYTTKAFTFKIEENIDNEYLGRTYKGFYGSTTGNSVITDDNVLAGEDQLNLAVSTGKAYIRGFEVEKIARTNLTLPKARKVLNVNAGISTFNIGNFANITNVYGLPDIGDVTGETTPYKEIEIYTDFTGTRGDATFNSSGEKTTSRGYKIGVCRARSMEYRSGTAGNTDAIFKLFLFDVRMITFLRLNTLSDATTVGAQVTGVTSGATGFVYEHNTFSNSSEIYLTNVVGQFSAGEKLKVSNSTEGDKILETSGNVDVTLSSVTTHTFQQGRSLFMEDPTAAQNFSADLVLAVVDEQGNMLLDGTDANAIAENDKIGDETSDSVGLETQLLAKLIEPEKNISLFKLPKSNVKTLLTTLNAGVSDTQFTVRRQFVGTTNSSGVVSFSAGTNETFDSFTDINYSLSILTAGDGTGSAGDIVSLTDKVTGTGGITLTITDATILGNAAKVKVNTTITKTSVTAKTKTTNLCKQVKVLATDADGEYGVRATDKEISLGRSDVYKLVAVYDSESTSADVTVPSMTLSSVTGSFSRGERIVGSSTGAEARIITSTTPLSYSLIGNFGATDFAAGEVITGTHSKATAVVGVLTAGSKLITNSFELDTGQRDNYYDISRIVRKRNASIPLGRLHIVFDYLSHGAGDVFTVDSYSSLNGQMNYDDIPTYSATKVDPDALAPSGTFELRDSFDFRPTVENRTGTSETITVIDTITGSSFHFAAREFDGTGGVVVNSPKANTNLQADLEFFVGYMAALFLHQGGQFQIAYGVGAEIPKLPKPKSEALRLADIHVPPFTFSPEHVGVRPFKTRRYTMRDIGKINNRLSQLEEVTKLTLLESATENFEILDQNGLSRFKSGFVVDTFKGHSVGAAKNKDYKCAMDQIKGELRPKCVMRNIDLVEIATNNAQRTTAGYRRTGDLVTLFYKEAALIDQPMCSRIENVQPYVRKEFIGNVTLSPAGDEWFDTEVAPVINSSVMGDYDTVLAQNQNSIGTFWGSWETISTGTSAASAVAGTDRSESVDESASLGAGWSRETTYVDTVTTTTATQSRSVTTTGIQEDIAYDSDVFVSTSLIPFCRSRDITITGECFMPNGRLYAFFDGVDVNEFVRPLSSVYSNVNSPIAGSPLIATPTGKIEAIFSIPEHSYSDQSNVPKFETQKELEFRLTSSEVNVKAGYNGSSAGAMSAGSSLYHAKGVMETTQETVTATKNAIIISNSVNETTVVSSDHINSNVVWDDNYLYTAPPAPPTIIEHFNPSPGLPGDCFLPHTPITMADGITTKPISEICSGDQVIGRGGIVNSVVELKLTTLGPRPIYGWNEKLPFVSEEHPLMTTEGWGAFNPLYLSEHEPHVHTEIVNEQNKDVIKIETGTELVTIEGNEVIKDLTSIHMNEDTTLYTIMLDGDDHTYYANSVLAHNKTPRPDPPPNKDDDDFTTVPGTLTIASGSGTSPDAAGETQLVFFMDQAVAEFYALQESQGDSLVSDLGNTKISNPSSDKDSLTAAGLGEHIGSSGYLNLDSLAGLSTGTPVVMDNTVTLNTNNTSPHDDNFASNNSQNDYDSIDLDTTPVHVYNEGPPGQSGTDGALSGGGQEATTTPTNYAVGPPGASGPISVATPTVSSNDNDNGGSSGSSGGGTVLCSLLHKRGYLPTEVWEQDAAFGNWVFDNEPEVLSGYHAWALPMTEWIEKDSLLAKLWFYAWVLPFTKCWAQHIAHKMKPQTHKDNKIGWFMLTLGVPMCKLIGRLKNKNNFSWLQQNTLLNKKDL